MSASPTQPRPAGEVDLVFLFGAGASYGDRHVVPAPPPLGAHLFDELTRADPVGWGSIPKSLRAIFETDFEAGMAALYDGEHSVSVAPLMRRMATFFLRFRWAYPVADPPEHVRLIRALIQLNLLSRSLLSSLNYECLLELAVGHAGGLVEYGGRATDRRNAATVCKLHGSSNMSLQSIQASGITFTRGVVFEGTLTAWTDLDAAAAHWRGNTALAPVMAMYMPGKAAQSGWSQLLTWWQEWAKAVLQAKLVVVIGVRPNAVDNHLWQPLATTPAHVLAIGNPGAYQSWARAHRSGGDMDVLAATFREGLPALLSQLRGV